ncbi:hypothetical protein PPERSA_11846 [Pseudocohnilembus persalinus]|uniref:Uncharacterized protein n=1 Tax=Pseudocohnilembus persalinus TaxID=266149 RepID=A0A0V0QK70_PSEPJ|nr:hypothetical protein PPERSA_11846 [Pseudocohnilembus persalinus]|eukprot:KRX02506.1 hypothetical protein PPERSA_11846 [Pseudocohnilembus persalinus]
MLYSQTNIKKETYNSGQNSNSYIQFILDNHKKNHFHELFTDFQEKLNQSIKNEELPQDESKYDMNDSNQVNSNDSSQQIGYYIVKELKEEKVKEKDQEIYCTRENIYKDEKQQAEVNYICVNKECGICKQSNYFYCNFCKSRLDKEHRKKNNQELNNSLMRFSRNQMTIFSQFYILLQ